MPDNNNDESVVASDRLVAADDAAQRVAAGALFIDVRSDTSRDDSGSIPGARATDRNNLSEIFGLTAGAEHTPVISYDTPIVVVCGSIRGSAPVVIALQEQGFTDVTHIDGGFSAWQSAGLPTDPPVSGA